MGIEEKGIDTPKHLKQRYERFLCLMMEIDMAQTFSRNRKLEILRADTQNYRLLFF